MNLCYVYVAVSFFCNFQKSASPPDFAYDIGGNKVVQISKCQINEKYTGILHITLMPLIEVLAWKKAYVLGWQLF